MIKMSIIYALAFHMKNKIVKYKGETHDETARDSVCNTTIWMWVNCTGRQTT